MTTIHLNQQTTGYQIHLVAEDEKAQKGKGLEITYCGQEENICIEVGIGKIEKLDPIMTKEIAAKAIKEVQRLGAKAVSFNIGVLTRANGLKNLQDIVEGILLASTLPKSYKQVPLEESFKVYLEGISEEEMERAQKLISQRKHIVEGILLARDWVNAPGNKLTPRHFVENIQKAFEGSKVEVEVMDGEAVQKMGMEALYAVGDSSSHKPYFVVLRYLQNPKSQEIMGLVGKGVTCDTGGYCLKSAGSMLGIKGDMAGAAAVLGAVYGLSKNECQVNVVACIPICENRISESSLLPGDVIGSLSGKQIEVLNTDAEGRLILADAMTYIVSNEKVTKVLDIATLTGAVVSLLGFSIGGVLCDDDTLWESLETSAHKAGERYLRIPFYKEHEKMIESKIADIKNMGESYCGTITAALFIREFAQGVSWIHLDIAGTAWVDSPVFEYQHKGATGAGVTSIYYLCQQIH